MPMVYPRMNKSGFERTRVVFGRKGFPRFSITFDDRDAAVDWAVANEELYYENPQKYIQWRKEMRLLMLKKDRYIQDHIVWRKTVNM